MRAVMRVRARLAAGALIVLRVSFGKVSPCGDGKRCGVLSGIWFNGRCVTAIERAAWLAAGV